MPLPAPVTIATFPEGSIFFLSCRYSAHGCELPRPLDVVGDAPRIGERALARVGGGRLVDEQACADLQPEPFPGRRIGLQQTAERLDREPVIEIVLLHAILGAQRLLDPGSRAPARLAHVLAQRPLARRQLDAIAMAGSLVAQDLPYGEQVFLGRVDQRPVGRSAHAA